MPSTWTYDASDMTSQISEVRMQLADTDFSSVGDAVPRAQQTALFSDQEYARILAMSPGAGDTTIAVVRALLSIANNRADSNLGGPERINTWHGVKCGQHDGNDRDGYNGGGHQ